MALNGGGSDQEANCILSVCCDNSSEPDSKRVKTLANVANHALPFLSHAEAGEVAHWIARNWDLAPYGSLYAFKQEIARLARGQAYND